MTIQFTIERVTKNGGTETSSIEFSQDEIFIGRGESCQVRLTGHTVSLRHARIASIDGKFVVEDLNSLSGVRVNWHKTAAAALTDGDTIKVADTEFRVSCKESVLGLTQTVDETLQVSNDDLSADRAKRLSVTSYLPSIKVLSVVALVGTAIASALPLTMGTSWLWWSSGPSSNAHKMVEQDCLACHGLPFTEVEDSACLSCHELTEHSKGLTQLASKHSSLDKKCSNCHMEHTGQKHITVTDSRLCVECHGGLDKVDRTVIAANVENFAKHPDFRITVKDSDGKETRVPLADKAKAVDSTPIKLNHALHLKKNLRGKDKPVTLECSSCHELAEDFRTIRPISFDRHCRDCHSLGFDERLPNVEVPHGNADAIYPTLFTEYTKILLLNEGATPSDPARARPGETAPRQMPVTSNPRAVESQAREAERQLFTRTGCFLCHDAAMKTADLQTPSNSHYTIDKPGIPARWYPASTFGHGAHEEIACTSCHEGANESRKTTDVLLPDMKECRKCHSQSVKDGFVTSECILCHSFHDPLPIEASRKRSIGEYINKLSRAPHP